MSYIPDLSMVRAAAQSLAERQALDVHTIKIEANGGHGGWDVTITGTSSLAEEVATTFILGRLGGSIHAQEHIAHA